MTIHPNEVRERILHEKIKLNQWSEKSPNAETPEEIEECEKEIADMIERFEEYKIAFPEGAHYLNGVLNELTELQTLFRDCIIEGYLK